MIQKPCGQMGNILGRLFDTIGRPLQIYSPKNHGIGRRSGLPFESFVPLFRGHFVSFSGVFSWDKPLIVSMSTSTCRHWYPCTLFAATYEIQTLEEDQSPWVFHEKSSRQQIALRYSIGNAPGSMGRRSIPFGPFDAVKITVDFCHFTLFFSFLFNPKETKKRQKKQGISIFLVLC